MTVRAPKSIRRERAFEAMRRRLELSLSKDVKASVGKKVVPLYRNHVFAQISPSTDTRIDLGLARGNRKTSKRLINTGGYKKSPVTHGIEIKSKSDLDDEVKHWFKTAHDLDE